MSKHDPYAAFRRPDFRRLLCAWVLAGFGQKMQTLAVGWYIYERTGSALAIGYVGLAQFAPALALFLPAGQLVDRHDRRSLMVASFSVSAGAALLMLWTALDHASIGWMYLACAVNGAANTLNRPARAALLPSIVPLSVLPNALAWAAGTFQVATFSGPVLAGLLIAISGDAILGFGVNFSLYVIALLLATRISYRGPTQSSAAPGLHHLLAGVRHVFSNRIILSTLLLDLASALFGGATALLPIYAKDILQVGPSGLGWLTAAPAVGAMAMAFTLGHLKPSERGGQRLLLALAGYGAATMVFGWSTSFALSLVALATIGAMNNINNVTRQTVLQSHTPDHLRGRVSSVNTIFATSSNELGAFECGTVAAFAGPVIAVVSGGAITILAVGVIAWLFPDLRRLKSLAPEPTVGPRSSQPA